MSHYDTSIPVHLVRERCHVPAPPPAGARCKVRCTCGVIFVSANDRHAEGLYNFHVRQRIARELRSHRRTA